MAGVTFALLMITSPTMANIITITNTKIIIANIELVTINMRTLPLLCLVVKGVTVMYKTIHHNYIIMDVYLTMCYTRNGSFFITYNCHD